MQSPSKALALAGASAALVVSSVALAQSASAHHTPTSSTSAAAPQTKTLAFITANDPTGPEPTSGTVKWPQTLTTQDLTKCGPPAWIQVDVDLYDTPADIARINAIIKAGTLAEGDDEGLNVSYHFVHIQACATTSPTPTTSAPTNPATTPAPSTSAVVTTPAVPSTSTTTSKPAVVVPATSASTTTAAILPVGNDTALATTGPAYVTTVAEIGGLATVFGASMMWLGRKRKESN